MLAFAQNSSVKSTENLVPAPKETSKEEKRFGIQPKVDYNDDDDYNSIRPKNKQNIFDWELSKVSNKI